MSAPRRLWMRVRSVAPSYRDAYRNAVRVAAAEAEGRGAHFWAFETDGGDGRYVEFLEGADDGVLAGLDDHTAPALDGAADGARPEGAWIEAGGLKCTELAGE